MSNTVDGQCIYYLVGSGSRVIDASANAGCVYIVNCSNVTVRDMTLHNNGVGVTLVGTYNSVVEDVTCKNNSKAGIMLFNTGNCVVRRCRTAWNNYGINVSESTGTMIDSSYSSANAYGVYCEHSRLDVVNVSVCNNGPGGGLAYLYESEGAIVNCTICWNTKPNGYVPYDVAGVNCDYSSDVAVLNSIVWGNSPGQIGGDSQSIMVRYSDVQGGYEGNGNIDKKPLLTPDGHLRLGSDCIDKGDPFGSYALFDIDGDTRVHGPAVDIGADEYIDVDGDGLPDWFCLLYTSPSPRDLSTSRMPSSA